jgi:8-oxo-dGTP pyrophosphatase MutT (NUDIX family)
MEVVNAVSCILEHEGRILILQRSARVGSFRRKWAVVSGHIEEGESPLERALKEIGEETGLTADDVKLVKGWPPLSIPDPERPILWKVHPYLFRCATDQIVIDWEHSQYRWIKPRDIVKYDTVPGLKECILKVYG